MKKSVPTDEPEEHAKPTSKKKQKKREPGLVSFLNTYHKALWIAKYNCTFVYENEDEEVEICEEVSYTYNY